MAPEESEFIMVGRRGDRRKAEAHIFRQAWKAESPWDLARLKNSQSPPPGACLLMHGHTSQSSTTKWGQNVQVLGAQERQSYSNHHKYHHLLETGCSRASSSLIRLDWLAISPKGTSCLWLLSVGISACHHTWVFNVGVEDLTDMYCASNASILPTEPSSYPRVLNVKSSPIFGQAFVPSWPGIFYTSASSLLNAGITGMHC